MKLNRRSFLSLLAGALAADPRALTARPLSPVAPRLTEPYSALLDNVQIWRMWETIAIGPGSGVYRFFSTPAHAPFRLALRGLGLWLPDNLTSGELHRLISERIRAVVRVDQLSLARVPLRALCRTSPLPIVPEIVLPAGREFAIELETEDLEITAPLPVTALLDGVLLR